MKRMNEFLYFSGNLREKLKKLNLTIIGLVLSVTFLLTIVLDYHEYYSSKVKMTQGMAKLIADNSIASLYFDDRERGNELIATLRNQKNIQFAGIYSPDKSPFVEYNPFESKSPIVLDKIEPYHQGRLWSVEYVLPILNNNEILGYVYIKSSLSDFYQTLLTKGTILFIFFVLFFLFATIVLRKYQYMITDPLFSLLDVIKSVKETNDYSLKAFKFSDDEFGELTDEFNDLIEQLNLRSFEIKEYQTQLESKVQQKTYEFKKAKEEAENALRIRSRFIANISHELRTPLSSIIGYSKLLLENSQDNKLRHGLGSIQTSGTSLLNMINDILDISKLESGTVQLSPISASMKQLIEEVVLMFQPLCESKSLKIVTTLPDQFPDFLWFDCHQFRQVLVNIIGNAVKYSDSGIVQVVLSGTFVDGKGSVQVVISDQGRGIPEDELDSIFEPFIQIVSNIDTKHEGTGLGLSISKHIVKLMGGDILVFSNPNQGTTFSLSFNDMVIGEGIKEEKMPPKKSILDLCVQSSQLEFLVGNAPDDFNQFTLEEVTKIGDSLSKLGDVVKINDAKELNNILKQMVSKYRCDYLEQFTEEMDNALNCYSISGIKKLLESLNDVMGAAEWTNQNL